MRRRIAGLLLLLVALAGAAQAAPPVAQGGVIDLRGWDFGRDGAVPLSGNWDAWWQRLARPSELADIPPGAAPLSWVVPGRWNGREIDNVRLNGTGFATYRLRVLLPAAAPPLALKFEGIAYAFRIFADGTPILSVGQVGDSQASEIPHPGTATIDLPPGRGAIDLVMQISNHAHFEGGPVRIIRLGAAEAVAADLRRDVTGEALALGVIAALAIYNVLMFSRRPKDHVYLLVGAFMAATAVRLSLNPDVVDVIYRGVSVPSLLRIEYAIGYFPPLTLYFLSMAALFPDEMPRRFGLFLIGAAALSTLYVLVVSPVVFTGTIRDPWQVLAVVIVAVTLYGLVRAVRRGRDGALICLVALGVFGNLAVFANILFYQHVLETTRLVGFSALFFVMVPAGIVALRTSKTFSELETLSAALEDLNKDLEHQVEARTKEADIERRRAIEASEAKSSFLAMMSHEIRTPLNAISGMTELLNLSAPTGEARRMIAVIQDSTRDLLRIIGDILDFSKAEAGKIELERIAFDPAQLVSAVADTMRVAAEAKGLALNTVAEGPSEIVLGDPGRLRQVLLNLVSNAVKFTEAGAVTLGVAQLVTDERNAALRFEVADTGIGIPRPAQARLFQPFTQADESTTRRFGGTGLGLSICRRLVEAMGARIELHSESGAGSRFWFDLVLERAPADAVAAQTGADNAAPIADLSGVRVLIAEDQPANRAVIARQMARLGVAATIVNDGVQALALYKPGDFDLMITDCHMPEMDGFELTRRIRMSEIVAGGHFPILALTANASGGEDSRCLAAGMDSYLVKPASVAQIGDAIASLIGRSSAGAAPLDFAALAALSGEDDPDELAAMAQEFIASLDPAVAAARLAIDGCDFPALVEVAHGAKGSARTMCAPALADAWARIETAARAAHADEAKAAVAAVQGATANLKGFAAARPPR